MTNYKILGHRWYTPPLFSIEVDAASGVSLSIGVVAIDSFQGRWKAYIGYAGGLSEQRDIQRIASQGMPLDKSAACGMFPDLNPEEWTS